MHPTIHLFTLEISAYSLFYTLAAFVAAGMAFAKRKSFGIGKWDLTQLLCLTFVSAAVGAKLVSSLIQMGRTGTANLASLATAGGEEYGAYLFGPLCVILFAKMRGIDWRNALDLSAYVALAYGPVASLGCLYHGCCYGIAVPWGVRSPYASGPVLPTQALYGLGFVILLVVFLVLRPERKHPGILYPIFLLSYCGVYSFLLEFLRGDDRGSFLMFTIAQWIAIAVVVAASAVIIFEKRQSACVSHTKAPGPAWRAAGCSP